MSNGHETHESHRGRLKQKFLNNPASLSDQDKLELLLTYAIPGKDVRPLADELLTILSSLGNIFSASPSDLLAVKGMGESTMIFLKSIDAVIPQGSSNMPIQPELFVTSSPKESKPHEMRVFANDEINTSLAHLPFAGEYDSFAHYKAYLDANLPYNSAETRHRRANNILDRFYPDKNLNTPLTLFTKLCKSQEAIKAVIFYHLALAEPLLTKVADEFIYSALPKGKVEREQLREFILGYMPDIGASSQKHSLRSIFYSYTLLGLGREDGDALKFQLRAGNLDALVYVLTAEFPEPGIYTFDKLMDGPAHRWLLWDKDWIRKQLYLLRDMGVVSKVSEIDSVKQFSLEFGQSDCLNRYLNASGLSNSIDTNAGDKEL